jgi:predicted secreted protein
LLAAGVWNLRLEKGAVTMPGFLRGADASRRPTNRARVVLTSGIALVALAVGAGATWASTREEKAPETNPEPAVTNPTNDPAGRRIDVYGPDRLPTTPVQVTVGSELVVHLDEQAGSTGYSWSVQMTGTSLTKTGEKVTSPSNGLVGAVGEHAFMFRGVRSGSVQMVFTLARPWETTAARSVPLAVEVAESIPAPTAVPDPASTAVLDPTPLPTVTSDPTPATHTVDVYGPEQLPTAVRVRVGDQLAVHLTERAGSTGYSWSATSVPNNLRLIATKVVEGANRPGAAGAAGERIFTYRVSQAGTGTLSFELRRPWEPAPVKTVTLSVTAQA